MPKRFTPAGLYNTIVNLDKYVKEYRYMPSYRPWKPRGAATVTLPIEYTRWEQKALPSQVDEFWYYIVNGLWRKAKKLSGLPERVIVQLMEASAEDIRLSGRVTPSIMKVNGIPLHRFLHQINEFDSGVLDKYANRDNSLSWGRLHRKERLRFAKLAEHLNRAFGL